MLVPVGVIAQAAAVAAYPFMARLFAEGKTAQLNRTVDRSLKWVLALSIGGAGMLIAMSVPVIRALFERFAFSEADSEAAAAALLFYAFAIPIWGALQIITRAFYSRRQMWTPVIAGTGVALLAIPTYSYLTGRFGIEGVALSSTLLLGLYTVILMTIWYRDRSARAGLAGVLDSAGRAIPLAVVGGFVGFLLAWAISANVPGQTTLVNLLAVTLGALAFLAVAVALGASLWDLLQRRPQPKRERPTAAPPSDEHDVMELL